MLPEKRDLAYLWDMREESKNIVAFTNNAPYAQFVRNKMIRYAIERSLLIIGEAANHVSEKFKEGMRIFPGSKL